MNPELQNAVRRLIDAGCYYRLDALATCYSRPPKASYGVAPLRRTTAYCLQRRALSETFGERLYTPDLQILICQENGALARFDYAQNLAFFRHLRDSGAPPRNTAVAFQPSEVQDGIGYVIATRRLDLGAGEKRIAFNLMLRQNATGDWLVFREHAFIPGDA